MHGIKKIVTAVILLILFTMFIFIKNKNKHNTIEIYPLENVNISTQQIKKEFYIVYGCEKKNVEEIIDSIRNFNIKTFNHDTLHKYRQYYYRGFYKRSSKLDKEYVESNIILLEDNIFDHQEDKILDFEWIVKDSFIFIGRGCYFYKMPIDSISSDYIKDPISIPSHYLIYKYCRLK